MSLIPAFLRRLPGFRSLPLWASYWKGKIFDWRHRVETSGIMHIRSLTVKGEHGSQGVQYEPISPEEMNEALSYLPIDFSQFAFVDFGSGKGRATLIASTYPFHRVIGVEFAKELHEIAERNVKTFRHPGQRCFQITPVHADATEYGLPPDPLVLYFNNPFREPVMSAVISNIRRSLEAHPREAFIISFGRWTVTGPMEKLPHIQPLHKEPFFKIYHLPPFAQNSEAAS